MTRLRRHGWVGPLVTLVVALLGGTPARGQFMGPFPIGPSFELSEAVTVDEVSGPSRKHFDQVKAFIAGQQWDDAINTLRLILEQFGDKVVSVGARRSISVRDYCHLLSIDLPPEALERYRTQIDPQAKLWYEQGMVRRDRSRLERVVAELYASRWGDDALLALGDLACEAGDPSGARRYWEQLLPAESHPDGLPNRLAYPDSDLERPAILARLVLASILEGSIERAGRELEAFATHAPQATGRLGGRSGNYVELLRGWLEELPPPSLVVERDWPTFAGSPTRNRVFERPIELGRLAWSAKLTKAPEPEIVGSPRRVAETRDRPLSYHPIVVGSTVLVHTQDRGVDQIFAFDLPTGQPAWSDNPLDLSGLRAGADSPHHAPRLGTIRFTLSAYGDRLYARVGNPATSTPTDRPFPVTPGRLACFDLSAEGRLVWDIGPGDEKWAFEGPPLCDGTNLYVAQRRNDVRPQSHVACLDAQTGRLKWRRFISSAEIPGQGQYELITHNLLTLHEGTLYLNTNLGIVAALAAQDGSIRWLYRYPRARGSALEASMSYVYRELTPCLYDSGRVFVAPADSRHLFALDANSGQLLWETETLVDAIHLLGARQGQLIASGGKAWWIRTDYAVESPAERGRAGKVFAEWPAGPERGPGFGRGLLAGDEVCFPTLGSLQCLDQRTGLPTRQAIELQATRGATGGNLVVAGGHLLIVNHDTLYAFALNDSPAAADERP